MGEMASIDIAAMSDLLNAMNAAIDNLPYDRLAFTGALNPVDVDASPAFKINNVVAWASGEVPGLKRRLALAQAIEAQGKTQLGVVQIDESMISNLTPAQAAAQAKADSDALKKTNGNVDPKVVADITANQNDPYFAAAFAKDITPQQLADVVLAESRYHQEEEQDGAYDPDRNKAWQSTYQSLLSACGTTIATATRGTDDLALPSDYAQQWQSTITGTTDSDGRPVQPGTGAAAALLLKYGDYDTNFLDTISSGVYNYERQTNQDGMWLKRSQDVEGNYEGPVYPDGTNAPDPLADIMSALGHNPQAAQDFFDVGNPNASTVKMTIDGQSMLVNARLKYLIDDRTWKYDDGTGIGGALQAATTFWRDQSSNGQISATIASQALALIGDHTGSGASDGSWFFGLGSHQGWKMWDGMRTNVANIVASYAPDLIRAVGVPNQSSVPFDGNWVLPDDPNNTLFPPGGPPSAWLDSKMMAKLLGTLGEDPKTLDIVNAGVTAAGQVMLSYAADRGLKIDPAAAQHMITGGQSVPSLTGATNALALTLSYVISSGYHGDKSKEAFDQARAEDVSKLLSVALSIPTLDVPEGHEWTGWLVDQAKDQIVDKLGEGPEGTATETYNDTSSDYQSQLQDLALNTLLQKGYFTDSQYAGANSPTAPGEYTPPPADAITTGPDGKPVFNFDSQGFHDWFQGGQALNTWIGNNVVGPFRQNLDSYN